MLLSFKDQGRGVLSGIGAPSRHLFLLWKKITGWPLCFRLVGIVEMPLVLRPEVSSLVDNVAWMLEKLGWWK